MTKASVRWDAGYPRVSTDMQVERDALQNQIQALEAYAVAQGLDLRLYPEEGVSAKDTDRPKLQELLADVRAGRVRSVLVTKLDRISRSLADLLDLMRLFDARDVKFVSLRDSIDTSGPVGRFMLHILGAIAELERGIIAERVAEDMKLRARRGKWNGGLAPYGREAVDGQLRTVPEEAALLRRMRQLLQEKRSWRGVAVALNREGRRTRGWPALERNGHLLRKGHAPAEWTPVSVKRVLLQPINAGTLVYNRRRASGKTHIPRPSGEHVVVEGFCAPIFSREELDELRRLAAQIGGEPPRRIGSGHVLSGLIYCQCGARMYPVRSVVATKYGSHTLVYYRCRRASHAGTCRMRQVPAAVLEPVVARELGMLGLDAARLRSLAAGARSRLTADDGPFLAQHAALQRQLERLASRSGVLLELAEDRLIDREEFRRRKTSLDEERAEAMQQLAAADATMAARPLTATDVEATLASLRQVSDIYGELEEVSERRRLLQACLDRLVVCGDRVQFHLRSYPALIVRLNPECGGGGDPAEGSNPAERGFAASGEGESGQQGWLEA
jgi:site-specific DNA recombinase